MKGREREIERKRVCLKERGLEFGEENQEDEEIGRYRGKQMDTVCVCVCVRERERQRERERERETGGANEREKGCLL